MKAAKFGVIRISPTLLLLCLYTYNTYMYLDIVETVYHLVIYMYVVQQDTQCGINEQVFIQHFLLARHVSDLIGPSSGAFCTSCIRRIWYVVIHVLLDTSSRYGWTCRVVRTVVPHTKSLRIQLVQNASDDGPIRSEICLANKKC